MMLIPGFQPKGSKSLFGGSVSGRGVFGKPCGYVTYRYVAQDSDLCRIVQTDAYISALSPGDHYVLTQEVASDCFCNTVFYSIIGACAYCQGDENLPSVLMTY